MDFELSGQYSRLVPTSPDGSQPPFQATEINGQRNHVGLIAVSYDPPDVLREFVEVNGGDHSQNGRGVEVNTALYKQIISSTQAPLPQLVMPLGHRKLQWNSGWTPTSPARPPTCAT